MSEHIYEAKTVTLSVRELQLIELGLDVGIFECQIGETDPDVKSIVEKLGLKKSSFNRLFPEEYARYLMLEMAEQRLQQWDSPVYKNPHGEIVNTYNSRLKKKLPRGYKVTIDDVWACIFVSVVALDASRCERVVPMECSCTHQVNLFKKQGLWRTRDYVPKPADFVYFNWLPESSDSMVDHVGIVVEVHDDYLITIEGNYNGRVKRVKRPINNYILGYGVPAYDKIYEVEDEAK